MANSAVDVAAYLLREHGSQGSMKLQKLVYYCQAYSLAWTGQKMFPEPIEAWKHGPVIRELWQQHKGTFDIEPGSISGDPDSLTENDVIVAEAIWKSLGGFTGWELRRRTHSEAPWMDAFDEQAPYHEEVITHDAMQRFYAQRG